MGDSLVVQWLRPTTFTAEGMGLIPGQGTKIRKKNTNPQTPQKKKKKKKCMNAKHYVLQKDLQIKTSTLNTLK